MPSANEEASVVNMSETQEAVTPLVPFKGSLANEVAMLQQDLEKSHKQILGILEPHLKAVIRLEHENALLQSQNSSLRDRTTSGPRTSEPIHLSPQVGLEPDPLGDDEDFQSKLPQEAGNEVKTHLHSRGNNLLSKETHDWSGDYIEPNSPVNSPVRSVASQEPLEAVTQAEEEGTKTGALREEEGKVRSWASRNSAVLKSKPDCDKEGHGGLRGQVAAIVEGHSFELAFGVIIVSNSVFIGVEVDWTAQNPTENIPVSFQALGYAYTALFTMELLARFYVDRCSFFYTDIKRMLWNYLDLFIVFFSITEVVLDLVKIIIESRSEDNEGVNLSNLRIIRIIRITKLMRLFRIGRIVRFVRALRTLIISIISTLKAVFWSLLLLMIIIYVYAILFTQASTDYEVEVTVGSAEPRMNEEESRRLALYWGTLAKSMLTLFMTISGGVTWEDASRPLQKVHLSSLFMFLSFVSFVYFAVLNVITGVFCEAAMQSQANDQDSMLQTFLSNKGLYTRRFMQLFKSLDSDNSGNITREEFDAHIEEGAVDVYFGMLGLEASDASLLFHLLDNDAQNGIDAEEFVHGCLRLKGYAKGVDLARLQYESTKLYREVSALSAHVRNALEGLQDKKI